MTLLAIFVSLIFLYSLLSARLEKTIITAPILFTAAGMLVLLLLPELREREGNVEVFLRVAEVGLVMLLFTDASRTDLQVLKKHSEPAGSPAKHGDVADHPPRRGSLRWSSFAPRHLGSRHPGGHPCADRCRAGASYREQPPRADADPAGPERGGRS